MFVFFFSLFDFFFQSSASDDIERLRKHYLPRRGAGGYSLPPHSFLTTNGNTFNALTNIPQYKSD